MRLHACMQLKQPMHCSLLITCRALGPTGPSPFTFDPLCGGLVSSDRVRLSVEDFLDPSHDPAFQPDLDPVGVGPAFREKIPDDPFRQGSRALVFLPHHPDARTRPYVAPVLSLHKFYPRLFFSSITAPG